jgi:hypothetical protein
MLRELTLPERVVLYLSTSMLLVKIIFEFLLGHWYFTIEPIRQYFFFTFLALEYFYMLFRQKSSLSIRPYTLVVVAFILVMTLHGVVVGFYNENKIFEIFNDTIPILSIAVTLLLFENEVSNKTLGSLRRFVWIVAIFAVANYLFGVGALILGRPSIATIGGGPTQGIVLCTLLAAVASRLSRRILWALGLILLISLPDMNRTILLFALLIAFGVTMFSLIKSPVTLFTAAAVVVAVGWVAVANLPPDSRLAKRLEGSTEYNSAARTGSIGERQAEADAVVYRLEGAGPTAELVGLGHGGVYSFQNTWKYVVDSGHAHFGWALFQLRYGKIGYVYLGIFVMLLFYSFITNIRIGGMEGYFHGSLALLGILFVPTWFTFNLMIAGLQFLVVRPSQRTVISPPP